MSFDVIFYVAYIGSAAFALSGFLAGARRNLDYTGIFIVSMLTANGGGAIRDILVGETPSVLHDPMAFFVVLAIMIFAVSLRLHDKAGIEHNPWVVLSDAIGLVSFSVTGAFVGIEHDLNIFGVMVLAYLTAAGGGIIRDILVNEVPAILNSDFYGTIAVIIALALYGVHTLGLWNDVTIGACFISALILRVTAYHFQWRIPKIKPEP